MLTGNLPCFSNVFIFDEETMEQEFIPFLYRVRKSQLNCLFMMILKECKNGNEEKLLLKIDELLTTEKNCLFLLLYSRENIEKIEKYLKGKYQDFDELYGINLKNKDSREENIKNIKNIFKDKVTIIYSDLSGAGKSYYINTTYINTLKADDKIIIYFPIKGHMDKNSLTKQLNGLLSQLKKDINERIYNIKKTEELISLGIKKGEEVKVRKKSYIIHIDLYDSLYESVVKEFLFYFIFFKFYGQNYDIFNYGFHPNNKIEIEIQIMIELPNTYKNYLDTYRILNYFPQKKINCDNKIIPFLNDEKIQIVSGVLNLYYTKSGTDNIENCNPEKNSLDVNQCQKIINEYLFKNEEYNLYQKINMIKYLSTEFDRFTNCKQLDPILIFGDKKKKKFEVPVYFKSLRKNIIESIIKNKKFIFEMEHIESILFSINEIEIDESIRKENHEKILSEFQKMKFLVNLDKLNPSLIAFHNNKNLFSLISSNKSCKISQNINTYINEINTFYSNLPKETPKYKKILKKKKSFEEQVKNPEELERENDENKEIDKLRDELLKLIIDENIQNDGSYEKIKKALKENFEEYVFTKDNFIKMSLLFLRIRDGIPTILMGETGSGKTFMIQMFSLIFSQSPGCYYIKKFHSGTTDEDVMKFMQDTIKKVSEDEDKIINDLKNYFKQDRVKDKQSFKNAEEKYKNTLWFYQWDYWFFKSKFEEKFKKYDEEVGKDIVGRIKNRKIIIFLDEINTSKALSTVKLLMCDYDFRKKNKIPDRFIIICACNPYRVLNVENQTLQFGLTMRNVEQRKLVYTVYPLPYSLLNFIIYFNDLSKETALKYIQKMNQKLKCSTNENKQLVNRIVSKSHEFISEKGDISSVSLREINKFGKFFNFFQDKYLNEYRKKNLDEQAKFEEVLSLSIYICYYLRLPSSKLRQEYIKYISQKIEDLEYKDRFEKIIQEEIHFITKQILGKRKGYALNKGLCENLFSEFICILLREPLIICGKPGSSKSLSMRLLLDAMKGPKSENEFFKQFPEVIHSFYQCSLTSTSENLEKIFEKAKKKLKIYNNEIISLIFMDEMGIADENPYNPLKVLHSQLDENSWEIEEKKKIRFYWNKQLVARCF